MPPNKTSKETDVRLDSVQQEADAVIHRMIPLDYYDKKKQFNEVCKITGIKEFGIKETKLVLRYLNSLLGVTHLKGTDQLYIYNHNGYYELLDDWLLQMLFRHLFNKAEYPWRPRIESIVLSEFKRSIETEVSAFDCQNCLNLRNGVLFLDSVKLESHTADNSLFTSVLDYDFNPKAQAPLFEKFIAETFCGDEELVTVMQEIFGYCLSISVKAEKAFFFYGTGCNGKSVIAKVLQGLIGAENTCAVSLDALNAPFAMSAFINKRVNIAAENEAMPNSEKLKTLISCDRINIPIKYREDWTGILYTKHVFLMNTLPATKDVSNGFFRKIMIIPFNNIVPKAKIDRDLLAKLLAERPGILNWALAGYKRLAGNSFRFSSASAVENAMTQYCNQENPTGVFFHSTYVRDPNCSILKSALYDDYILWAEANGAERMTRSKFLTALQLKAAEPGSGIDWKIRQRRGYYYLVGYNYIEPAVQGGGAQ